MEVIAAKFVLNTKFVNTATVILQRNIMKLKSLLALKADFIEKVTIIKEFFEVDSII